jgi:hypothetical protein
MGRINGENVAGAAFLFFAILFLAAGTINPVIDSVKQVFYVFVVTGLALVFLGYRTYANESKIPAR